MFTKAALSLVVIGASGAYVWSQSATRSGDDLAAAPPAAASESTEAVAAVAVEPPLIVREVANTGDTAATAPFQTLASVKVQSIAIDPGAASATAATVASGNDGVPPPPPPQSATPAALAPARQRNGADHTLRPIKVSAKVAGKSPRGLADGTYDGPAIDAFYGLVQIEANIQNGKLASIKILQFPSDRRTSIAINRQALPVLKLEAIAAQTANVDVVSGATLTSEAFIESLSVALRQARA